MRNEDALLFLSYLNFDYKIKDELLNHFTLEHIEEIFDLSGEYFKENKLLTKNNIEKLVEERKKFNSDAYRDFLEKKKVKYVSILSENYPINLRDIEYIPQVIYYKGDILPEDEFALFQKICGRGAGDDHPERRNRCRGLPEGGAHGTRHHVQASEQQYLQHTRGEAGGARTKRAASRRAVRRGKSALSAHHGRDGAGEYAGGDRENAGLAGRAS